MNYSLKGIIEHNDINNHYIAHVLRINNKWQSYNNLKPVLQKMPEEMHVASIFYITDNANLPNCKK